MDGDVQVGEGADVEPDWDMAAQPVPDDEVDQRGNWCLSKASIWTAAGSSYSRARPKSILHSKVLPSSGCERSNRLDQTCFEAQNPCHPWFIALKFLSVEQSDAKMVCFKFNVSIRFRNLFHYSPKLREFAHSEPSEEAGKGCSALAIGVHDAHTVEVMSLCVTPPMNTVEAVERAKGIESLFCARKYFMTLVQ